MTATLATRILRHHRRYGRSQQGVYAVGAGAGRKGYDYCGPIEEYGHLVGMRDGDVYIAVADSDAAEAVAWRIARRQAGQVA